MGTCCGKQDSMGAYRGPEQAPKGSSSAPPVASPPAQRRKGSIAAYQDGAQSLQKEQQKSWDVLRRIPVLAETFKPENQRKARRGSVVCELKSNEDEQFIRENLSNHPLFSHLSRNQVSEIAAVMEQVEYAPDAPVYHSWELGKDFFLIKKGRVKFTQSGDDVSAQPDGSMGRKMSINMAGLPGAPSSAGSGAAPLPLSPPGGVHASPMMGDGGAADAEGVIELGVGASFGELAAMWSSRRGFTATTMGVCTLFTIDREALRRAITQSFSKARTELSGQKPGMGYFSKVPLLVDLQACSGVELDLSSLADCMGVSSAVQGEVLCTAGGAMDRFMLVTRGEVSVKLDGIGGADGEITLQRGDYLGEACLVRAGLKWTLTATSLSSETSCAVIERDVFRARFDTLALGPGAEGTADTASEVEAEQPLQPSSVAAEREGPLLPCSPGEVPLAMRGRRYAEVLRASAASKYEAAESLGAVADQASSAAEAASAEAAKRQWEGEAPLKEELSTADFNFCCALNSGPLKQSRERLVGNAFWAGTDGWRAGVRVYLCTHRLSGTPYAVRVYDNSALWAEVQSARILSDTREELKLAHSLAHPRLLPLLSCFQDVRLTHTSLPTLCIAHISRGAHAACPVWLGLQVDADTPQPFCAGRLDACSTSCPLLLARQSGRPCSSSACLIFQRTGRYTTQCR
jgi:CRP-like cAMP-binding protein